MFTILIIALLLSCFVFATSPPILNHPLASQLHPENPAISSAFLISAGSALLSNLSISSPALRVPPSWSFSIGFLGDTFLPAHGDSQTLSVDAHLDTGNPLPDWLHLSRGTITFGGVTPEQSHGVQVLKIVLTATSSSSLSTSDTFTLIVSPHDFSVVGPLLTRNVTADTKFSFVVDDWQGVQIDGERVPSASPNSLVTVDRAAMGNALPPLALALNISSYPWLAYDATSRILTGTPPAPYAGVPGPLIPAFVTLVFPTQSFTVSTNLTLDVFPSAFTMKNLPPIIALPGTAVAFSLAPFLSSSAPPSLTLNAKWDTKTAKWLSFDQSTTTLNGTVPQGAHHDVEVSFTAHDAAKGTDSRAEMVINLESGGGSARTPTDRALRKTAKNVSLVVGLVCGIIAAIILLASFLAICRRYCTAHENVDGVYVIDQSAFDEGLKGGGAYEKEVGSNVDDAYLAKQAHVGFGPVPPEGRMITKAAFFSAMRGRFGSDGSWRGQRIPNSGSSSGKRARKSKISKPMVVLSSSTSVHDGFADRARGGVINPRNIPFYSSTNFTIFGNKNNPHGSVGSNNPAGNSPEISTAPPPSLSPGRALLSPGSSAGTAVLPYDRSRSSSDPSQNSASASGGGVPDAKRSGSVPSMATGSHSLGTQTGTQSTFATGDSTRLTNAAGEVPFRRPGFDGRRETLAERNIREMGGAGAERSTELIYPSRVLMKAGATNPIPKATPAMATTTAPIEPTKIPLRAALKNDRPAKPLTPPKPAMPLKPSKSSTPPKADTGSNKGSPHGLATGTSSKSGLAGAASKPDSEASPPAPSSYRNVFFGDKDNESDGMESGAEDVEHAVIRRAVQHTSNETLVKQNPAGKPRLVAFTHERTAAAPGQVPRRDVSQKVVVHGSEDSDPEAEMRMGLEYVRQLGHPEAKQEVLRTKASTSHVSLASSRTDTPVEYYASNDSNGSIAGRTRIMSHLVINSHRHRHQTAYSTESAHESFVSSGAEGESRWMVEAELPQIILGPGEPFNFAAPLDRAHKHASVLAGSALQAKQADGRALPEWLRFRNIEREFWGVSPKATNGETGAALVTRVVVHIWEAEKSEVVGGCLIDVLASD